MITTIQIREEVKKQLDHLKINGKETYEEVILYLVQSIEKQRRGQKELMIEGYKEMAEESLAITHDFEQIEEGWN
jgi:predicted CopG family antitoxin